MSLERWWGPIRVSPMTHIEGRGYAVGIDTPYVSLQLWVSEQGRNIRVWRGNDELIRPGEGKVS